MLTIPTLHGIDSDQKRKEIKRYFQLCYKRYESLFDIVVDESAYFQKADPLRHPIIFYYGHTATFFINKFKLAKIIDARIDPKLESIFAVGVDEMSWDDLNEAHYNWPTLAETQAYRDKVYETVSTLIDTLPLELPITDDSLWWVILMGIEHENIHLETSSVLIRQLPFSAVRRDGQWKECESYGPALQNELLDVSGGTVILGKNKDAKLFGWDNEYGEHQAHIPAFKAAKYLTSNAEFLDFIHDAGYSNDAFWCEEGKAWKTYTEAKYPMFWKKAEEGYRLRTLSREIDLPLNWPVEVNHLEAAAFCKWKSEKEGVTITLPTEDEYIRLRDESKVLSYLEWTEKGETIANINLEGFASCMPVDTYNHGNFYDVIGNIWQWSRTPIYPFDGFKVHPIYDDFTVPTFDGKHNLINGGSWISCGNLATQKSRYGFRRHFYQHAGFRYIESDYEETVTTNIYNTDTIISQYCHFGWGENALGVENYPAVCGQIALAYMKNKPKRKAFDIGCAIGRSTFELARGFDEVIGVDFSARFIQEAESLKENGVLRYTMSTEGELENFHEVNLSDFDLEEERNKVSFWQADACNLKPIYKDFDLIFGGNLIDRLYDPKKFLDSLSSRMNEGGILILTSPYTWQEESTPKEKWIGGYKRDGENVTTLDGLKEILGNDFELIDTKDVPFVIQETARKHQYTIAHMTVWQKEVKMFEPVNRQGTHNVKWDEAKKKFGTDDLIPLWVADMDLASPKCVQESMMKRASHPLYGYTIYPDRYYKAIQNWMQNRFSWKIEKEWIVPCYGVVPSLNFIISAFSKEGDGIIVQTPIYPPFVSSVKHKNRRVLDNTLMYEDGSYHIDFEDFTYKAKEAKLFLLCSPHNPTGRVWSREELERIIEICIENDVLIISDEIHADIVYDDLHQSIGSFENMMYHCVILNAPSKTFNVAGLNTSYAIIPDIKLRQAYRLEQDRSGITNGNPFGIEALISAYDEGAPWLEQLKEHLLSNITYVKTFLQEHQLPIHVVPTEATFLMWLDCKGLGLSHDKLVDFFVYKAKLGLNDGMSFGDAGEGFMRLNVGTSKEVLKEAMERLLHAYKEVC